MLYLIEQQINEEIKEDLQKELFKDVINLYCDELFYKLIGCSSPIYSQVGVILANICNFERAYLEVAKPKIKFTKKVALKFIGILEGFNPNLKKGEIMADKLEQRRNFIKELELQLL